MRIRWVDLGYPGRKPANCVHRHIAKDCLDRSGRRVEKPEPSSGWSLPRMVEIDSFARVVQHGVWTLRCFEGAVSTGGHLDVVNRPEPAFVGVMRAVRRDMSPVGWQPTPKWPVVERRAW